MNPLYLSTFNVDFRDYDRLLHWMDGYTAPLGAELAACWFAEGHEERMLSYLPSLKQAPITIHGPFIEMCTRPGSEAEEKVNRELQWSCELYRMSGAKSIVLHTHAGPVAPGDREEARSRVKEVLNHWIPRMQDLGMDVCVENVGYPASGSDLFSREEFLRLFDALPQDAGCLIDTGHAFLNHWDVPDLIRTMGTKICGYHLNNNDGHHDVHYSIFDARGVCPRQEMEEILRTLGAVTPDAHVILEYNPTHPITDEVLFEELDRVRELGL